MRHSCHPRHEDHQATHPPSFGQPPQKRIAAFKRWLYARPESVFVAVGHSSYWKHFCAGYCGVKPERMYNCEIRHLQL